MKYPTADNFRCDLEFLRQSFRVGGERKIAISRKL